MTSTKILQPVTLDTADANVRPTLEAIQRAFGQIPNLMGGMANSPSLLNGYLALSDHYDKGTLSPMERQLVLLAVSESNECRFCAAAHSTILKKMLRTDEALVEAVRLGASTGDARLDALVGLARALNGTLGRDAQNELDAFFAAGYTEVQVAEVIVGVGLKVMSNTLDHLAQYELGMFAGEAR